MLACVLSVATLPAQETPEQSEKPFNQVQRFFISFFALEVDAVKFCNTNEYKFFVIKRALIKDSLGQTIELRGSCQDESGELIALTFENPEIGSSSEYEMYCYKESTTDETAIDVVQTMRIFKLVEQEEEDEQEEEEERAAENTNVKKISSLDDLMQEVSFSEEPVFVECYSSTCPPCRALSPRYDEYSLKLSSAGKFLKVNIGEVEDVAAKFNIRAVPTLLIFKEGAISETRRGMPKIVEYLETLKETLKAE